jgi:hypothetical protein
LTFRRAGCAVAFALADPPDLRIEIEGVCVPVKVKHFRGKRRDDLDIAAMRMARGEERLTVIGQCGLNESGSEWEQVVRCIDSRTTA